MICCICGDEISDAEDNSLKLKIDNIRSVGNNSPWQQLFAHGHCFENALHYSIPFLADALMP